MSSIICKINSNIDVIFFIYIYFFFMKNNNNNKESLKWKIII